MSRKKYVFAHFGKDAVPKMKTGRMMMPPRGLGILNSYQV